MRAFASPLRSVRIRDDQPPTKRSNRRHAYYVCTKHQKEGVAACPRSRVAAGELEQFVVEQIREIGRDPELIEAIVAADKSDRESLRPELSAEARKQEAEMRRLNGERENLVTAIARGSGDSPGLTSRVAELGAEIATAESAASAARNDLQALDSGAVNTLELRSTLSGLDPLWDALFPAERARLLDLLLERIEFDGGEGDVAITFRPGGPQAAHEEAVQ